LLLPATLYTSKSFGKLKKITTFATPTQTTRKSSSKNNRMCNRKGYGDQLSHISKRQEQTAQGLKFFERMETTARIKLVIV
jgi:hypothetical protein